MKIINLLFLLISISFSAQAQIEHLYDFNDLEMDDLGGQDNWVTIQQTNGENDFFINITASGVVSADGSKAVFYDYGGPGVGRTATRKATPNFDFDFSIGGVIELEVDMHLNWWGAFFGAGFDADGDGHIAPGLPTEENDGGIMLSIAAQNPDNNKIILPNGESFIFSIENPGWCKFKLLMDFNANDGEGALALFYLPNATGEEWIAMNEVQGVNMGLTPGSGDKMDYEVWDGIFFHSQGGVGAFDNIVVRQAENNGQLQFIEMAEVPNMLTTDPPYELEATATSGLPVEFEITEGPATINGNILTLTGEAGIVTIKASQPGDDTWAPASNIYQSFEVVDPQAYNANLTIRRPAHNTNVYMSELSEVILVASAYIEHHDVLHIENVEFVIDGQSFTAEKWATGYNTASWTPPSYGTYSMTVNVTTTGNVLTTNTVDFEVVSDISDLSVQAFDGLELNNQHQTDTAEFVFPTYAGAFNQITALLDITCPPGGCEPWDRMGYMEVRGPTGEWVELFRYITPYGVECSHNMDATDYSSILQGIVEMRFHIGIWQNGLVLDVDFNFTAGEPEYKYSWVDVIWRGTYPFGDYANLQPVEEIVVNYEENVEASKLKVINTGHSWGDLNTGNAAEFYEATHKIKVNDDEFDQHLWVTCNPNPDGCQPQNGTWYFNRAGWCPGSISYVYDFDLTPYVNLSDVNMVYEFAPDYVDYCHPNHPDCVTGVTCADCNDSYNPNYVISGNLISFSNEQLVTKIQKPLPLSLNYVKLLPNPAIDFTTLSNSANTNIDQTTVTLFYSTGQVLRSFEWNGEDKLIDLSTLKPGLYFIVIENKAESKSLKLIVE
jgi:hypothetical protein